MCGRVTGTRPRRSCRSAAIPHDGRVVDIRDANRDGAGRRCSFFLAGHTRPEAVGVAVQIIWKALDELLHVTRRSEALRAVWILAVLLCRAPEEHEENVRFRIDPLTEEVISPATGERPQRSVSGRVVVETAPVAVRLNPALPC